MKPGTYLHPKGNETRSPKDIANRAIGSDRACSESGGALQISGPWRFGSKPECKLEILRLLASTTGRFRTVSFLGLGTRMAERLAAAKPAIVSDSTLFGEGALSNTQHFEV